MKKTLNILFGALIAFALITFFVPSIFNQNTSISAFSAVFCSEFNFLNLFILLPYLCVTASGILTFFFDKNEKFVTASLITMFIGCVFLLFPHSFYEFANGLEEGATSNGAINYVLFGVSVIALLYIGSLLFKAHSFTVRDIVEIAMFVALAVILDIAIFKIKIVASGGSISFVMVPLFVLALRKGFVKGFISLGIIFGLITCMLDGYGFFTFPFDYLLGFGGLALIGIFKDIILPKSGKITIKGIIFLVVGVLIGLVARTIASTISGIVIYQTEFLESLVYQLTYIGPSGGISLAALLVLYKPILLINRLFPQK